MKFSSGAIPSCNSRRWMSSASRKYNQIDGLGSHSFLLRKSFRRNASFIPAASGRAGLAGCHAVRGVNGYRVHDLLSSPKLITTEEFSESKRDSKANSFIRIRRKARPAIPFVIQRGGTSKGVFFRKEDLPESPLLRDLVIKDAFGSPDVRQIDGLGGADVLTSKVAIVSRRTSVFDKESPNINQHNNTGTDDIVADVDYLFGQVEFGNTDPCSSQDSIDIKNDNRENYNDSMPTGILYDINCGNISAGVGPYAIEEGLIEVTDDTVTPIRVDADGIDSSDGEKFCQKVRIHNVNTGKVIVAEVPVEKVLEENNADGLVHSGYWSVVEDGDYEIDGVPGKSAYLPLDFSNCVGTLGSRNHSPDDGDVSFLLPSGNPRDTVVVDDHKYDVSLLDVANFVVHIDGRQLGLTGKESSTKILNDKELWNKVRKIRYEAAKLVMREEDITLTKPFTSVVFPFLRDHGYETIRGNIIRDCDDQGNDKRNSIASIDFRSFVLFCDHPHKAYPGTASNATAAAALIEGTVVSDVMNNPITSTVGNGSKRYREKLVSIGHPSGRMSVSSKIEEATGTEVGDSFVANESSLVRSVIGRTSRRIADGRLYLKSQTVRQLIADG